MPSLHVTAANRDDLCRSYLVQETPESGEMTRWVIFDPDRHAAGIADVGFCPERWGNRPAFLWMVEGFWVLRFRLMV
jgi:hypothetical protein